MILDDVNLYNFVLIWLWWKCLMLLNLLIYEIGTLNIIKWNQTKHLKEIWLSRHIKTTDQCVKNCKEKRIAPWFPND